MGFTDRLKEAGRGVANFFQAPIGLVWDTTRAIGSSEYNPGFFGVFGPATEKAVEGLSQIGSATGLSSGLSAVGETPVGEGLKSFWNEMELLYSTEFQQQQRQAPWGLRNLGVQPGDLSLQRVSATGINALGTLRGNFESPQEWWRRSEKQSPGQAIYESVLTDFYSLNPRQQEEVKASGHYNMITGTVDAVARWFLSPDVLLGKGLKKARQAGFIFDPQKALERARTHLGGTGIRANATGETLQGLRSVVLGADDTKQVYSVVRSGQLESMVEEGSFKLSKGMDEFLDTDQNIIDLDLDDFDGPVDYDALAEELGDGDPGAVMQGYLEKGLSGRTPTPSAEIEWVPLTQLDQVKNITYEEMSSSAKAKVDELVEKMREKGDDFWTDPEFEGQGGEAISIHQAPGGRVRVGDGNHRLEAAKIAGLENVPIRFVHKFERGKVTPTTNEAKIRGIMGLEPKALSPEEVTTKMEELLAWVEQGDASAVREFMEALRDGGASPNLLSEVRSQMEGLTQSAALRRANRSVATADTLLGSSASRLGKGPRYPGSQARPVVLFADEMEAKRYAAALYDSDPSDVPMILDIKANGLQAAYEEFDLPLAEVGGDGAFFTMADKLNESNVRVRRLDPSEIDRSVQEGIVDYLEPGQTMSTRLYSQDGRAIEPDQAIGFDDLRMDFETAMRLPNIEAQKYLEAQASMRANQGGNSFYDVALSDKRVQQVLNRIGKLNDADEIRRVFFPDHPLGQRISIDLADARNFQERRTILAAYMGYRLPEVDALPPLIKAKIDIMMREIENVKAGRRPNEVYLAMIGEPGTYTDLAPEQILPAFEEILGQLENQQNFMGFLDEAVKAAPVRQLSVPYNRVITNLGRRTRFYQQSSIMRPVRVVTEMKPHRFINVRDGLSDVQLVRQLEEAAPLGITAQETKTFREAYMRATNDQAKLKVVTDAETLILQKAAKVAKLTKEEFEEAMSRSIYGRRRVQSYLASRRYAPGGRDQVRFPDPETGELAVRVMPLLDTQVQAWMPMADVREIIKSAKRIGEIRSRFGAASQGVEELLSTFYSIWKPSVLLRGGWMLRVVSDEQLRILAKSGSLLRHLAAIEAGERPAFSGIFHSKLTPGQRTAELFTTMSGTQPIVAGSTRVAAAISKGARKLKLVDPKYWDEISGMDVENLVSSRASFGGPNETMLHEMQALFGRDEATILDHLYTKSTGQWRSVVAGDRDFGPAWQRVLTKQYGESPVGRKITQDILEFTRGKGLFELDDAAYAEVVKRFKKFLTDTREGREVAERMPWRAKNPERWADDLIETLNDYTAGFDDTLMDGVLNKKVTTEMMESIDEALRPDIVHSEIIDQALGTSPVIQFMQDFVSSTYDLMGRLPTDTLSRQPFFKQLYGMEMMRIKGVHAAQGIEITEDILQAANKSARAFAIGETKKLLYDLAEVSRFGDMMRFITPFYSAWQEVIGVWAGLAIQDPSVIARAKLLWQAPNRADMVYTDDEGQEFIQLRLSEKMADKLDLTGWKRYVATGGIRLGKASFNLVLNSPLPGVGPLIQYPVNEVIKNRPELEESLRFLLPFGVNPNSSQIFLSPLVRQIQAELEGPTGDRAYVRAWQDAISWMDVEYRAGRRTDPPTEAEAHDIASKIHTMRAVTRLMSPVQPIYDSPLQPYMDIYRDMIEQLGPEAADEAFLNEYGTEFFAVTLSRTVSKTGIPPTAEAEVARREFEGLIQQYPEYGRLIIGDAAIGEFSTGAYAAQLERPIDPDNPMSELERTYRPTELDPRTGRVTEIDRRLGWQEYIKMADLIDLRRQELGLPNLRVAAAEPLAQARTELMQGLAAKYPAWWEDYNTRDELKWDKRIDAFRSISTTDALADRPDIQGLSDYLNLRSQVLQELNRRKQLGGSSTLGATANMDLADLWETAVASLLQDNVAFGPLYYRYLEGDTLTLRSNG